MKKIDFICFIIVVLTMISASIGIFYSTGEEKFTVKNIYGESIELYGDGIYKYNTILAAGANKGTDLVMLFVAVGFAFFTVKRRTAAKYSFYMLGCYQPFFITPLIWFLGLHLTDFSLFMYLCFLSLYTL